MAEARTDDRAPASPAPAILDANLAALQLLVPQSAERVRTVAPPSSVRATPGRDGKPTFNWIDESGRLRWLGHTSMPSISSAALVDAFQDGGRNVLLVGFGQGAEARLLLDRLALHQALMIVEENAWCAGLALRLRDFSDAFQSRRMPLFVGPSAWDELEQFLLEHAGYLTPERMLSWPWFDAKVISEASSRLLELGRRVAQHRAGKLAALRQINSAAPSPAARHAIALLSNVAQPPIRRLADNLSNAAENLGWATVRLVLDDPSTVHPLAAEQALISAAPVASILLETGPRSLQYQLPPGPAAVICIHRRALAMEWIKSLPAMVTLAVPTHEQRRQALETGRSAERVLVLPPAAAPGLAAGRFADAGGRVVVVADGADTSANAAGLHLASHRQLWEAATAIIEESCDAYTDEKAAEILAASEKRLKIRLDSEEVRAGLVDRIRQMLAPAVVNQAYCMALVKAGVDFDLRGEGWAQDAVLSAYWRGPWPRPWQVGESLEGAAVIVSLQTDGGVKPSLLDGLASGLAGMVRSHPSDDIADGLRSMLDPNEHVWRFSARAELVKLVRGFLRHPGEFAGRAEAAARHINAHHTWSRRLESILQSCGVR